MSTNKDNNNIGAWIFFLIVGGMMIYGSADEASININALFQKIIGFATVALIAYLVIQKFTK